VLGFLPTHTVGSSWRDIKVLGNYAYIVSEAMNHGMQIFDLTLLRKLNGIPLSAQLNSTTIKVPPRLQETGWYGEFGSAHNIVINEESGFAYVVGSKTCRSGLHIIDLKTANPLRPTFSGCYSEDGYVHDAQCVIYSGPDSRYTGKEICFCYDEDTLTIVDVHDKRNLQTIARKSYNDVQYTHQGWLLKGQGYLLLNDELDELQGIEKATRTLLWDVKDLRNPIFTLAYFASEKVIDHNLYTLGDKAYLSNYCGGLRILDVSNERSIHEVAFFDVSPDCATTKFLGSWSSYPYFKSGTIVVNSIDRGLFIVKEH